MESKKRSFNIQRLNRKVLEEHFDNCISVHVEIDFKNLIAPYDNRSKRLYPQDMNIIEFMSDSIKYKHLIVHPLISSFVMLKLNRLASFIYTDFAQHFILMITTMLYVLKGDRIIFSFFKLNWLKYYIWALLAYLVIRRIGQQIFLRGRKTRYNACAHYSRSFRCDSFWWNFRKQIAKYSEQLPFYRHHLRPSLKLGHCFGIFQNIFENVAWNPIKSLQLCIIALPALAASFNLLYRDPLLIERESVCQMNEICDFMIDANSDDSMSHSPFSRFDSSLLKIIVIWDDHQ